MLPIVDLDNVLSKWIAASFTASDKQGWQLSLSILIITLVGIAFDFLDDVPCWLHCVLKSNGSDS